MLKDLARRQADPVYAAKFRFPEPVNAFVHPEVAGATFPKRLRQKLIDNRSSAVEDAKVARPVNFRKRDKISEYATKVWTAEELKEIEMEEMAKMVETKLGATDELKPDEKLEKVEDEDIDLDKLKLDTEPKDVNMGVAGKSKSIRKKRKEKKYKSYKIINF